MTDIFTQDIKDLMKLATEDFDSFYKEAEKQNKSSGDSSKAASSGTSSIRYAVAQCLGAIAGAFVLMTILKGQMAGYDVAASGLGQNGWGAGYLGEYTMHAAFLFEVVATFLFMTVILGSTHDDAHPAMAGLAIGLTLVVIHIVGIQITGVSVNPARSLGPALFVGGQAMEQLWLFAAAPVIGASLAAIKHRWCPLSAECCGTCTKK